VSGREREGGKLSRWPLRMVQVKDERNRNTQKSRTLERSAEVQGEEIEM